MLPRILIPATELNSGAKPRVILGPSRAGEGEEVLAGILLDKVIQRRKPLDWLISVAAHAAMIGAILVAPMFFARQMVFAGSETTFLVAPPLPVAPPPPLGVARAMQQKQIFSLAKLTVPVVIPKTNEASRSFSDAAPDLSAALAGSGAPDGSFGGILGGAGSVGSLAPAGSVGTLRVGGQVQRPQSVYNPEPEYPSKARKAKIQGDVQIDAIVDKDGNVVQAHALSGPPLLIEAAIKAVSQWKYEPTYLNGSPYPLELIVDVNFRLS